MGYNDDDQATEQAMACRLWILASVLLAGLPAQAAEDREPPRFAGMVAGHDRYRAAVGLPGLKWSGKLEASAAAWAQTLRGRGCAMQHSGSRTLGENLAWASGARLTVAEVLEMWGEERRDYDHAANRCRPGAQCGHYTQMVWRGTTEIGCAAAACGAEEVLVCHYAPPGNWVGQRPY
jgi:pathogenesis-related protein 1